METLKVPVGISNRHIHLSQEHIEALFGVGYSLTKMNDLSQPGRYAYEETVTLIGPKGTIPGVRILGSARKASQVELTRTDTHKIGINPPVRDSGNIAGSPGIDIEGPKGLVRLNQGVIIATRHLHMSSEDAWKYSFKDGEYLCAIVPGPRGGILEKIRVRVNPNYTLDLHVDTDEANAYGLVNGQQLDVYSTNDQFQAAR
ncbi:MAG: propanediol utilization protein [Desulfosporosinus sp. BRH_c37]|nr:MAG: propanediol utilization protein [Desulfosporosinus sp. BRH_c37]